MNRSGLHDVRVLELPEPQISLPSYSYLKLPLLVSDFHTLKYKYPKRKQCLFYLNDI